MAVSVSFSSFVLFFVIMISVSSAATVIQNELETTLHSLSIHGYTLFSNAITTSDIKFHLLSNTLSNFTIFAPKDTPIFNLDITSDALDYVSTLKYHVIPNHRLTFSDLINLSSPFLDTLLPHYSVLIGKTRDDNITVGVLVDGARVSDPDLFVGTSFVVHGIDGILSTGSNIRHQGFDDWLGSGQPAVSPGPVSGGVAPASWVGLNVPVGAPVVASAPKAASVGNIVKGTRQKTVGANVPARKETRQGSPVGTDKLKKKVHRMNRGRGRGHGHKRHRQQQQKRNHDL